jgi:hypothetical protein
VDGYVTYDQAFQVSNAADEAAADCNSECTTTVGGRKANAVSIWTDSAAMEGVIPRRVDAG